MVGVLTDQPDVEHARNYWKVLKHRLKKEGNESVTNCNRLKLMAEDGKQRLTDVADMEQLFRIIQSVPSSKAEPIKLWMTRVVREQVETKTGRNVGSPLSAKKSFWNRRTVAY